MADEEDYFGDITVSQDAEEDDHANDVTFGDIGDLKAGDQVSEATWAPDHETLAKAIEAEKEAILNARFGDIGKQSLSHNSHSHPSKDAFAFLHSNEATALPVRTSPFATQREQIPSQAFHHMQTFGIRDEPTSDLNQRMAAGPTTFPLPHPNYVHSLHHHQIPMPTEEQRVEQQAFNEQQRRRLLYEQQQQLLQSKYHHGVQHYQQMHYGPSPLMPQRSATQPADPAFGNGGFQLQQQQQQRDDKSYMTRQLHRMQMVQEAMMLRPQQNQQRPVPGFSEHSLHVPFTGAMKHGEPPGMQHRPDSSLSRQDRMPPHLPGAPGLDSGTFTASMNGSAASNGHEYGVTRPNRTAALSEPHVAQASMHPRVSKGQPVLPPLPVSAVRLDDLERKLVGMSVAPTNRARETAGGGAAKNAGHVAASASPTPQRSGRRLQTMTDKDLELVLRMHLRQLDTPIPYRDDFYFAVYRELRDNENTDMYGHLGQALRELEGANGVHRGRRKRGRGPKRGKSEGGGEGMDGDVSSPKSTAGAHTSQNLATLAHALGTIQSWTPKAPRRLMDYNVVSDKSVVQAMNKRIADDVTSRSIRDDERVLVRVAVEEGYDIMNQLQDVARRKASYSVDTLLEKLYETLHISDTARSNGVTGAESPGYERTRFFVRMCVFEKGRRYVSRVLKVLRPAQTSRVLKTMFENLSMLLYAIPAPTGDSENDEEGLWEALKSIVRDPNTDAATCLEWLVAFGKTHVKDKGALMIALGSVIGANLIYITMQRIFAAQNSPSGVSLTENNKEWEQLCSGLTSCLGDVFENAESTKSVWEVAAMLDALSHGEAQGTLRLTLKTLLDSGRAPPPPGT